MVWLLTRAAAPVWRGAVLLATLLALTASAAEFMDVSQVKVGMKGFGRSVFKGTKIEDFQVEVLGVMPRAYSGHDLIMVRCSGADLEKSGVVAGMSGSPVYLDGKMVGALSMAFLYQKEPIAMITPIKDMLEILDRQDEPDESYAPGSMRAIADAGGAANRPAGVLEKMALAGGSRQVTPARPPAEPGIQPIPCPIAVSGLDPRLSTVLGEPFSRLGLELVPGSGEIGSGESLAGALEPGAAVAVSMVRGDMTASAIGTITYRDGNRILAFGHPMFQGGPVAIPMCGGVIHTVMSSIVRSGKAFSPTAPIGAITQDRACGIAGTIGQTVPMIPVSVRMKSPAGEQQFRYELLNQPSMTPNLLAMTIGNSWLNREQAAFTSSARAEYRLKLRGRPAVTSRRWFSGDEVWSAAARHAGAMLELLLSSEQERVAVESISVEIEASPGRHLLTIARVEADRDQARPGDSLRLLVTLAAWRGPSRTVAIDLKVPAETPEGDLRVLVTNPDSALLLTLADAGEAGLPRSVSQMVKLLEAFGDENQLVVQGYVQKPGVVISGERYPNLPPSTYSLLSHPRETGRTGETELSLLFEQRRALEQIVAGAQVVRVNIVR
jgi:hypothetical protein